MDSEDLAGLNIDFYFIHRAYKTVNDWFTNNKHGKPFSLVGDILKYFNKRVSELEKLIEDSGDNDG